MLSPSPSNDKGSTDEVHTFGSTDPTPISSGGGISTTKKSGEDSNQSQREDISFQVISLKYPNNQIIKSGDKKFEQIIKLANDGT